MARIIIIAPSQPSRTPRLVRNADALAAAGHEVIVVTPVIDAAYVEYDSGIIANAKWQYLPVDLLDGSKKIGLFDRVYRKLMFAFISRFPFAGYGSDALMYGVGKIESALKNVWADLYLAQQQASLPLVARMAMREGKPYACDIEDILTQSTSEPVALLSAIETRYLKDAAVVSTMSEVAADYLDQSGQADKKVLPLHNCPEISERGNVGPPSQTFEGKPSIYWFGQTLGSHSLALELIEANAQAGHPFRIALRGKPVKDYVDRIAAVLKQTGSEEWVEILPVVDTTRMVSEAAGHDILYGSQPSRQMFHQLAVGNKVFTGLLAGCGLLLTDTIAHRKLRESLPECMLLVDNEKQALVKALVALSKDRQNLIKMRNASWDAGTKRYHWGRECEPWIEAINAALKGNG